MMAAVATMNANKNNGIAGGKSDTTVYAQRRAGGVFVSVLHYMIQCYRETPGDADCHEVPIFGESLEEIVEGAGVMLLAYFNDPKRSPARRPLTAHLEDEDGQIIARIRITGPGKIERVTGTMQ